MRAEICSRCAALAAGSAASLCCRLRNDVTPQLDMRSICQEESGGGGRMFTAKLS